MRTLENTEKNVTVETIAREIGFEMECEAETFTDFIEWLDKKCYFSGESLRLEEDHLFWTEWLCNRPEAQEWFVQHGFATWIEPKFEPFTIQINTLEEARAIWHRLNMSPYDFENSNYDPSSKKNIIPYKQDTNTQGMWEQINDKLEKD